MSLNEFTTIDTIISNHFSMKLSLIIEPNIQLENR